MSEFTVIIFLLVFALLLLCSICLYADDKKGDKPVEIQKEAKVSLEKSSDFYLKKSILKIETKDLILAKKYANKSLELDPLNADAYAIKGRLYAKEKDYKKAIDLFDKAISINNEIASYYYNRALAKTYLDRLESSIDDCDMAIKLNPIYSEAYLVRGISEAISGESESSMEDFRKAITFNSNYGEAYYNIGLNYYELRDDNMARTYFKEAEDCGYLIEDRADYLRNK